MLCRMPCTGTYALDHMVLEDLELCVESIQSDNDCTKVGINGVDLVIVLRLQHVASLDVGASLMEVLVQCSRLLGQFLYLAKGTVKTIFH